MRTKSEFVEKASYTMVDLRSGECIVADGRVETPIGREDYKNDQYYHFADNGIYRLLVSKCVQRMLGPDILASMNNRYLVKKVVAENASCPELEAIRAEYTRPIVIEVCGAEFLLNRRYGWYEGTVGILGGACKVSLYLDSNSKMKAKRSSTRFEALMQNMEELDGDMFGGHAIFVNVNTRNEIVRCELAG